MIPKTILRYHIKPYSASILAIGGFLLSAIGVYFIFVRPPLLPEDLQYVGATLSIINATTPNLLPWLQKVFWVMGGYIFTTGLQPCICLAQISLQTLEGHEVQVGLSDKSSIHSVNFQRLGTSTL
jgi:hypothetical protein